VSVRKGQGILIFPDTSFHGESVVEKTKASVHHFTIDDSELCDLHQSMRKYVGKKCGYELLDTAGNSLIDRDLDRSLRLSEQSSDRLVRAMQGNLLCLALAQLQSEIVLSRSASARKMQVQLRKLVAWLSDNLSSAITVDEMAKKVTLSGSHLRRVFRAEYGSGPAQYFQEMKMREARRLLRESGLPIKVVASELGFRDLAHFYRSFKKQAGMPPADYRDRNSPIG